MAQNIGVSGEVPSAPFELDDRRSVALGLLRRFLREKPLGAVSAAIILAVVVIAVFAPLIATHPRDFTDKKAILLAPSSKHYFGTDKFGRDVFSRIVYGSRVS